MYFVSIDAEAQVAIILLSYEPCVVIVNLLGQVCTLGRAHRTNETLPDFREWCRVTRHSRVFRGLMGCQWTPGDWGVTSLAQVFIHVGTEKNIHDISYTVGPTQL